MPATERFMSSKVSSMPSRKTGHVRLVLRVPPNENIQLRNGRLTSLLGRAHRLVNGRHLVEPGPTGSPSRRLQGRAIRRGSECVRDGFGRDKLHERVGGDLGRRSRGAGVCGAGGGVPSSKRCVRHSVSGLIRVVAHLPWLTGTEEESEAVVEGTNLKLDLASVSSADKQDGGVE